MGTNNKSPPRSISIEGNPSLPFAFMRVENVYGLFINTRHSIKEKPLTKTLNKNQPRKFRISKRKPLFFFFFAFFPDFSGLLFLVLFFLFSTFHDVLLHSLRVCTSIVCGFSPIIFFSCGSVVFSGWPFCLTTLSLSFWRNHSWPVSFPVPVC